MSEPSEINVEQVARLFQQMGADGEEQAKTMARQLLKRARQIATEQQISEVEAAQNLLRKVVEARQGG